MAIHDGQLEGYDDDDKVSCMCKYRMTLFALPIQFYDSFFSLSPSPSTWKKKLVHNIVWCICNSTIQKEQGIRKHACVCVCVCVHSDWNEI